MITSVNNGAVGRFSHGQVFPPALTQNGRSRRLPERKGRLTASFTFSWVRRATHSRVASRHKWLLFLYLPRTTSMPDRIRSSLARGNFPVRSVRSSLSSARICETLATESFGSPVRRDERSALPAALAGTKAKRIENLPQIDMNYAVFNAQHHALFTQLDRFAQRCGNPE